MKKHIKTWDDRCNSNPLHNGIVSNKMIQEMMQEEIDDLRKHIDDIKNFIKIVCKCKKV